MLRIAFKGWTDVSGLWVKKTRSSCLYLVISSIARDKIRVDPRAKSIIFNVSPVRLVSKKGWVRTGHTDFVSSIIYR